MTRTIFLLAGVFAFFATPAAVRAQLPDNLAQPKAFRRYRLASTDPNFKNHDSRSITPGAILELGKIEGHGQITHVWFTIAAKSKDHLRELVLRMYWDGAEKPAVEYLPFGRFLCPRVWPLRRVFFFAVAIGGVNALNCYWPMPFDKSARLTLTNEGSLQVPACYYNIDYRLDDQPAGEVRYFHTQYRQAFPVPKGKDYVIVDTVGRGHFVGTFLT